LKVRRADLVVAPDMPSAVPRCPAVPARAGTPTAANLAAPLAHPWVPSAAARGLPRRGRAGITGKMTRSVNSDGMAGAGLGRATPRARRPLGRRASSRSRRASIPVNLADLDYLSRRAICRRWSHHAEPDQQAPPRIPDRPQRRRWRYRRRHRNIRQPPIPGTCNQPASYSTPAAGSSSACTRAALSAGSCPKTSWA